MIDAPIVWEGVGVNDGSAEIPTLLQTWASSRGLRLVTPREGGAYAIEVDAGAAEHVEEFLHQARELVTQHDADGAERALARAEALLRAHPELPQGAWLMAEVERGWASRFARLEPSDAARAARHWRAAAALDGGRAAGVGEVSVAADAPVGFSIDVGARATPRSGLEMRWDGDAISPGVHTTLVGLHQLVAKEDGHVVFAQWIAVAQNETRIHVALPTAEPCTRADLTSASLCATWISAKRTSRSPTPTFIVRVCARASCGPELTVAPIEWRDHESTRKHGLPAWAGWTLAGIGIATVVGVAAGIIAYFALPPIQQTRWTTSSPE